MRPYLYLALCLLAAPTLLAQTSQVEFGKNRVQYHNDFAEWEKYESDNFITYWYGNQQGLGQAVVQLAEYDFAYIQKMLEHRMNDKVQLIVYRDVTDLKQSNIGSEEVFTLPGNQALGRSTSYISATQTKFLGNKAFVHFNGDHRDLRRQVREAMASVYIEHMLYGSSVQEVVQNAVLLNLPDWFKTGLVGYLGEDWNSTLDDQLRQLITSGEYEDFEDLAAAYPRLAGHSFWYYIAENLGKPTVSNLLYLTRINRSVENGFLYVLGTNYENVLFNYMEFYRNRYQEDLNGRTLPETEEAIAIKNKKRLPITQLKISPDGQKVAYVLNEIGKYKVYLHDFQTGEREMIFKSGQRNLLQATDYNYPLLDWAPTNRELSILYEFRDEPRLMQYDVTTGKDKTDILSINLDRVYSMAYVDPARMIMSASVGGFTDLYTYFPASRQFTRITNDHWDDLDAVPVRVRNRRGVVWVSNRPDTLLRTEKLDTILPIDNYDVFYYDLEGGEREAVRVTRTPLANERSPSVIDTTHFAFLSDASGIYNRYQSHLEDFIHHYEQTVYLTTGDSIVLHADSTMQSLDTTLIESITIRPVIRERAVTEAVTDYTSNIEAVDGSDRTGFGVSYFANESGQFFHRFRFDTTIDVRLAPTAYRRRSYRDAGQVVPQFTDVTPGERPEIVRPNTVNAATEDEEDKAAARSDASDYLFQTRFDDIVPVPTEPDVAAPNADILNDPQPPLRPTDEIPGLATPREPTAADSTRGPSITRVDSERRRRTRPVNQRRLRGERPIPELNRIYRFRPGRVTPSRLTFRVNYVRTTADNDPLFAGLNSYAANPNGFTRQPLGILFKGQITDLFEDYTIEGGVRVPTSFSGTEYFVTAENRKRRLDFIYSIYRRNRRVENGFYRSTLGGRPRLLEENTLLGQFGIRYPLDVFRSLRATATLRRDRVQTLPTELAALQSRPDNQMRAGIRMEYVFDNTINLATNLRMGSRYKVYTDFYKSFRVSLSGDNESGLTPGFLGLVGFDARHYQRLDRRSILALRMAGVTNFGAQKILYYLGGADNELINNFNQEIPTPQNEDFVFQDLANPLRGFQTNIRNGGTYILGNAELRVPVFNYLFGNLRSAFLRDFQVVGFFDVGSAWAGRNPYDENNPVNITNYPDAADGGTQSVRIRVRRFREPIVYGYGTGVRTTLFGYFVRLDRAWGVETSNRFDGRWHFSLGYDF